MKKRIPAVSALLSIIQPGLGQVYNGQMKKGICYFFGAYILMFVLSLTRLQFNLLGLIVLLAFAFCYFLFVIGDAIYVARKIKEITLKPYNRWYNYIVLIILGSIISTFVFNNTFIKGIVFGSVGYKVPAVSMKETLQVGDRFLADLRYYYFKEPIRGDVIVFKFPEDPKKTFIKRVIGVGGDIVEIRDKQVFVNNKPLDHDYGIHVDSYVFPASVQPRDNFGPVVVPDKSLFVMGDNRDQSYDSRFWGFVDLKAVMGKALMIYWSWDKENIGVRWNRIGLNIE